MVTNSSGEFNSWREKGILVVAFLYQSNGISSDTLYLFCLAACTQKLVSDGFYNRVLRGRRPPRAVPYCSDHSPYTQPSAVGILRRRERQPGRGSRTNMQTTDRHGKQHEINAIREIQARSTMKGAVKSILVKVPLGAWSSLNMQIAQHDHQIFQLSKSRRDYIS